MSNVLDIRNVLNVEGSTQGEIGTGEQEMTSYSTNIIVDNHLSPTSENPVQNKVVTQALAGKEATISDLATIRSGAALGATAVQPGDLAEVATSGAYSDLSGTPTIPTVDQTYSALSTNAQSGVAVASAINDKADTDLANVSATGTSTGAGWAMPSSIKEAITVGASGASYQAPANGWFSFVTTNTATQNNYTYLINETTHISFYAMANAGITAKGSIEVKKGDYATLGYFSSTISEFYFVYAEGSKSEAN